MQVVVEVGAVEGLGQDAGRRGLARAPGPAQQVGVGDGAVSYGVAQGGGDVVLAADLAEALGSVAPVERLVAVSHDRRPYRPPLTLVPGQGSTRSRM